MHERIISKTFFDADSKAMNIWLNGQRHQRFAWWGAKDGKTMPGSRPPAPTKKVIPLKRKEGTGGTPAAV
jgi:hypothetical protein